MKDAAALAGVLVAVLLSLFLTWSGFEFYHQMRAYEFFSAPWLGYGVASLASVVVGGAIMRALAD